MSQRHKLLSREDIALILRLERRYAKPYRLRLLIAAACLMVGSSMTGGLVWLMQPAFDEVFIAQRPEIAYLLPIAVIALTAGNGLALFAQSLLMASVTTRVSVNMQSELFERFVRADLAFLTQQHSAVQITNITAHVGAVIATITGVIIAVFRDIFMTVVLVAIMFARDWQLALVVGVTLPLLGIGLKRISNVVRTRTGRMLKLLERVNQTLYETLGAARLIKLQGAEAMEIRRYRLMLEEMRREGQRTVRASSASTPINEIAGGIAIGAVILYGTWRTQTAGVTVGALASFLGALIMAYRPIKRLASLLATIQGSLVSARVVEQVLNYRPQIVDAPDAVPLRVTRGELRFEQVRFGYAPGKPVLDGIDLTVPPGRTVALVGPSGGGKTTLLSLIPRLYDVDSGAILIDGQDVRRVTLASLRAAFSVVSQETVLFDDTVRANIAYGKDGASDAEIERAAKIALADGFIRELPKGYATPIGERGVRLSGGQRQRLAIARAVLKDAPILLLDEATSSLDQESEAVVKAAIKRLMENRTTIVVAHRLSTIIDADQICVMSDGRIVERGTHGELLARGGLYAQLYNAQRVDTAA